MKDATGELSMTAVAVVAIAAISVVFTTLIWPSLRSNIISSSHCSQLSYCDNCPDDATTCKCYYINEAGIEEKVTCKNPNRTAGGGAAAQPEG